MIYSLGEYICYGLNLQLFQIVFLNSKMGTFVFISPPMARLVEGGGGLGRE